MTGGLRVRAEHVTVRRGGRAVVDDVSLVAGPGTLTALVGPSGSGKTTMVTVLAALERADAGTVSYDDLAVTPSSRGPWIGRVQVVHQAFGLLSLLSAAENVELAGQALPRGRRPRRRDLRAAAATVLDTVGLADRVDHLVEELSGGEQQRVALARALVTAPDLLFADEPTAQLDAGHRERLIALLRATAARGVTVVVATHDPDLTAASDTVVHLADGRRP